MKKMYTPVFIGRSLFALTVMLLLGMQSIAQTPQYFKTGTGTGGNTIPLNQASQKTQLLYTPTDFNVLPISGFITKIYFRNSAAASTSTYTDFKVSYIQNTDPSFPSTSYYTGLTTALSAASITVNGNATAGGWFEIPIPAGSFPYDNSKTLIIEIQYTARTGGISTTTSTSVGNKRCSGTSLTATTGTTNTIWNDFGIDLIPAGPCVNPPVPGTVTSSASAVCLGIPFTLSMTGGTNGSGQTYQWQISPDNIGWTDIPGQTNQNLTTTQTSTNYYRLVVTCGVSVNSNSVLVTTPAAVSGTFTIDNNFPTGSGNFQSFNDAYDYIKCGISGAVTFNVVAGSGPYTEQLIMIPVPGASATNTVTFNGNGASLNFLSANTNQRAVIKLDGADHITFNGLTINALGTTTTEYGFGVQLMNNADSNTINNCTININTTSTSTNYAGIVTSASATSATGTGTVESDFNTFSNNTITGGYYGITLVGSTTVANGNNKIINNEIKEFYFYGIYVLGSFNLLVEANELSRPTRTDVSTFQGIYFTGLSVSANITRNRISNPFGGNNASTSAFNGIYFTGNDGFAALENKVTNNLIYNITGSGDVYGIYNTSSDNVWYYHNTISLDGTPATSTATSIVRGFFQTTLAGGIEFRNNIITISRAGLGTKYAMYFATATSTIGSNNNNFYISSTTGSNNIGFLGSAQPTLIDWQTASLQDANSITTDPLYANATGGNFAPTNASVDNLGAPLGITVDILNNPRSATTPDMGAYEFSPGACTVPPTPGVANASPNPVCEGALVSLSLTGNSTGLGQTYQWESSPTIAGVYSPVSGVLTNPGLTINATSTLYYRVAVTCSGNTVYSTPVLLTVNPRLPANTYTIDKNFPTGGLNYASFNDAKAAMSCGIAGPVIFNVVANSGPYTEQLILEDILGTSAFNTVTFNGNGNTIRFNPTVNTERAVIKLRSTDHIIFDSLVIDATLAGGTYGYGVQLFDNADSNTFRRCTIIAIDNSTSTNFAGVVINASETAATTTGATLCDGNLFDRNTITGGYYGITNVGATATPVLNNTFTNNNIREFYFYGIYVGPSTNTYIEKNNISRPTRATVSTFYGVYFTGLSTMGRISKNRIHNPFGGNTASTSIFNGIYFTGVDAPLGSENIVSNNLIYNVNGDGAQYGLYNTSSNNVLYYYNTVSLDDVASTTTALTRGFFQTTASDGIILVNNIFTVKRGGTGTKHALYFATAASTITSNWNDLYVNGAGGSNFTGFSVSDHVTLANWQAATTQDPSSVALDPEYANPLFENYTPTLGAIDNLGVPVANINTDILDVSRSATTPDMGAYEFVVPPCTTPPTAGTSVASPNSGICLGATVILSLSGNSTGGGQTYQWQSATSAAGPWTNISPVLNNPVFAWQVTAERFFRAVVTCNSISSQSTHVEVILNPAFLSGFYTINPANPPVLPNFQTFAAAVAALECGITGFVTFDVAPGTYNEQIRMHSIAGTGTNSRVTFRAANGVASSVNLSYDATVAAANYTLKLDSASYITFRDMTITAVNTTNGRAIEIANTASFDSIVNCIVTVPTANTTATTVTGIYANLLKGTNNVIKGNTVNNGSNGIYIAGTAIANLTKDHVIDSNTVNGAYFYGIYGSFTSRIQMTRNTVNLSGTLNTSAYGIYATNSDTAYNISGNKVNIDNTTVTAYGIYVTLSNASVVERGKIAGNTILASTGNTGVVYGLYVNSSSYNNTVNNVISIKTSGASSYGLYSTTDFNNNYYNNSVNSLSSSATNNVAAYFNHTSGATGNVNIRNNIFAHNGGGLAMQITNANFIYSDYNFLYTSGASLVRLGTVNHPTLQSWINATFWDVNSMVYKPSFVSGTDLQPNLADPDVWAMHGRGVQIPGNDYDFNNNPRPTTLTTGVPDMGAYEFLPTSLPTVLTAIPAVPAPNTIQTFMYGTDTVARIAYSAATNVPTNVTLRRYSGVLPPGLPVGASSMYFYTQADVTGAGPFDYTMNQYYIDPWQGFIPTEPSIKLGRTDASNNWQVFVTSTVDDITNVITEPGLTFMDKFTGLTDGTIPPPPIDVSPIDTSNSGTRFWVSYGHHQYFGTDNSQDMVLYLSAEQTANVTVRVNGTSFKKVYNIPANTVRISDILPKTGIYDSRQMAEGLSDRGISISSDVPIVAYAHIFANTTSGATMLMPVGTYGYDYTALTSKQNYGTNTYSWFNVIASRDSTLVRIVPSKPTLGGRPAGVPFDVYLKKGEVYQVLGALISGNDGQDMTGSKISSIPNASGKCYPIAVFSGSSRTNIGCVGTNPTASGDNIIQQNFPSQAWGRKYLIAPTSNSSAANSLMTNIFRVAVKDPLTEVRRNGTLLTGLIDNFYYQFESNTGDVITADKPVMVAQFMSSSTYCPNTSGGGDPEMIYVSPVEQGIKRIAIYRNTEYNITVQYLTLIVPTAGVASLRIDGSPAFDHSYPHTEPGYTVVVKRWTAAATQAIIQSDSAFTAITYGLGSVESYGYNAGTLVKNLNAIPNISNTLGNGTVNQYTCSGTPFRFSILISLKPTVLTWQFSQVANLSPNVDIIENNPTPVDSVLIGGRWFYKFTIPVDYTFSSTGTFAVPILITHPDIEGCSNTVEITLPINVIPAPVADFTANLNSCIGDVIQFNGTGSTSNGVAIGNWNWDFGDSGVGTIQNPTHQYTAPGTYNVTLKIIGVDGCLGDTTKQLVVNPRPVVDITPDSLSVCLGTSATFTIQNPITGATYNWYDAATGGNLVHTGNSFTVTNVTGTVSYYAEGVAGSCTSVLRKKVTATILAPLTAPVVVLDSAGADFLLFKWDPVPNAIGYEVSTDNGNSWNPPSSGTTGLTHRITGLQPLEEKTLIVRALGQLACQNRESLPVTGKTYSAQIYIPNTFTPNGDGLNDVMQVYGFVIKSLKFVVFNQWGEKINESANKINVWDGTYKGKPQPSGVYMYVCQIILNDGSVINKKGSINLIR